MPRTLSMSLDIWPHGGLRRSAMAYLLLLALLGGCATAPVTRPELAAAPASDRDSAAAAEWRYVRFRLGRTAAGETNSFLDQLIADLILRPRIAEYRQQLQLWRFHRRWAEDSTGHQFSFIFLALPAVADRLGAQLERDRTLQRLRSDGHLVEFRIDRLPPELASDPAATSDTAWSPEVQREWPKFILGASRMWLGLVHAEALKHADLDLYERYRAVELALDDLWFKQANHAFFHHLSALFGYKPMRVIRRDIMTF